jgi:hypothetical protein
MLSSTAIFSMMKNIQTVGYIFWMTASPLLGFTDTSTKLQYRLLMIHSLYQF